MAKRAEKTTERHLTDYQEATCLVRITKDVKKFIVDRSRWEDSIDNTLRRLLGIEGSAKGRSKQEP